MKLLARRCLFGASLLPAFASPADGVVFTESAEASPVLKVVDLVRKLKDSVTSDAKIEQQSYDKYACWCEDTLARKAKDIAEAQESLERLNKMIPKLGAEVASHEVEVKQLKKEIEANMRSRQEATEVRKTESAAYAGDRAESESCMGALEAATRSLAGAGSGSKAFLDASPQRSAQLLGVAADVRRVLSKGAPITQRAASDDDLEVLRRFADSPVAFAQAASSSSYAGASSQLQLGKNNPFGDYAPQSTQIQGILKGMYDSFAAELEKGNAEEASKQKAFEELSATKQQEHDALAESLAQHEGDRARKGKLLADSKNERDETKDQLKADKEFFQTTKAGCKQKAQDWSQRSLLRTQELKGIAEALDILSDPANTAVFNRADATLVQISSTRHRSAASSASSRGRAASASSSLQAVASRYGSSRLGRIAAEVKTAGHFGQVMTMIDQMVADLRQEEQDDIEHRDRCENAERKNGNDLEDLHHSIGQAGAEIDRLAGSLHELELAIHDMKTKSAEAATQLAEMTAMRTQEQAEFRQAVKDDTMAIELVQKAIEALSKFSKNKKPEQPADSFLQQEPKYTVDPDQAPETNWEGGEYGGKGSQTSGVLGALGMIVADLKGDLKTARSEEDEAQAQFEGERDELNEVQSSLERRRREAEVRAAELEGKRSDHEASQAQLNEELGEQKDLQSQMTLDCSWVKSHFESRREQRKAEIEGLQQAKTMLSGAEQGDYDEISVVEATA